MYTDRLKQGCSAVLLLILPKPKEPKCLLVDYDYINNGAVAQ